VSTHDDIQAIEAAFRAVQAGVPSAYVLVINGLEYRLRLTAASFVPTAHLVDDVVQEAFLTIYEQREQYRPGINLVAWCRQIVHNHARNAARAWRREQRRRDGAQLDDLVSEELEQVSDELLDQAGRHLATCLQRLPERSAALLQAHYGAGASLSDLAAAEGRPASWARTLAYRARHALARCLRQKMEPT
jgi:RNA polymerase sigma factor (sigma-70 family)